MADPRSAQGMNSLDALYSGATRPPGSAANPTVGTIGLVLLLAVGGWRYLDWSAAASEQNEVAVSNAKAEMNKSTKLEKESRESRLSFFRTSGWIKESSGDHASMTCRLTVLPEFNKLSPQMQEEVEQIAFRHSMEISDQVTEFPGTLEVVDESGTVIQRLTLSAGSMQNKD